MANETISLEALKELTAEEEEKEENTVSLAVLQELDTESSLEPEEADVPVREIVSREEVQDFPEALTPERIQRQQEQKQVPVSEIQEELKLVDPPGDIFGRPIVEVPSVETSEQIEFKSKVEFLQQNPDMIINPELATPEDSEQFTFFGGISSFIENIPFESLVKAAGIALDVQLFGTGKEDRAQKIITSEGFKTAESETSVGRIAEAIKEQAILSFSEVGAEEESLRGIEEFSEKLAGPRTFDVLGIETFNPLREVTETLIKTGFQTVAVFLESFAATIETGMVGAAQVIAEATGDRRNGIRFIRDAALPGLIFLMAHGSGAAPRIKAPKQRPKTVEDIIVELDALGIKKETRPIQTAPSKIEGGTVTIIKKDLVAKAKKEKQKLTEELVEIKAEPIKDAPERIPGFDVELIGPTLGEKFIEMNPVSKFLNRKAKDKAAAELDNAMDVAMLKIGEPEVIVSDTVLSFWERRFADTFQSMRAIKNVIVETGKALETAPDQILFRNAQLLNGLNGLIQSTLTRGTPFVVGKTGTFTLKLGKINRKVVKDLKTIIKAEEKAKIEIAKKVKVIEKKAAEKFSTFQELRAQNIQEKLTLAEKRLNETKRRLNEVEARTKTVDVVEGDLIFNGEGFNSIVKPLKGQLHHWVRYMLGKRILENLSHGKETLFTKADAQLFMSHSPISKFKRRLGQTGKPFTKEEIKLFEKQSKEFQSFNSRILDFAVQMELISSETKVLLLEFGKDFLSMVRIVNGKQRGRGRVGTLHRRLTGGEANIRDPFQNIISNFTLILEQAMINKRKVDILTKIEEAGLTHFAERAPEVTKEFFAAKERLVENLIRESEANGIKLDRTIAEKIAEPFTTARPLKRNQEVVFIKGKKVIFNINDTYLLKALESFKRNPFPLAVKIMSIPKKILTAGVTLTLEFVGRNFIRDVQQSVILTKDQGAIATLPLRVMRNVVTGLKDRVLKGDMYHLNLLNGGGFSSLYKGDMLTSQTLMNRLTKSGVRPGNVLDTFESFVVNMFSIGEEAVRQGEFAAIVRQGKGLAEGSFSARVISTDFALRGTSEGFQWFMATLPFANARAQGLIRIGEQLIDTPVTTALKGLIAITLPSLALYSLNKDKPEYKELPDWLKDNYYVFFLDSGDMVIIPKGFEAGQIFATIPERLFEAIELQHGKKFTDSFLRNLTDTLFFDFRPQFLRPIHELDRDRGFFGTIEGEKLKEVKPSLRFKTTTSTTLVEMTQFLSEHHGIEWSPIQTEHLIRGYLGTLGGYALFGADLLIESATENKEPSLKLDEIPVIRGFFKNAPLKRTQYEEDFYKLFNEVRMLSASVERIVDIGRRPSLGDPEESMKIAVLPLLNEASITISSLNSSIEEIVRSSLSSDQKTIELDKIFAARNKIFRKILQALPEEFAKEQGITQ